jgi:hypothetical protein
VTLTTKEPLPDVIDAYNGEWQWYFKPLKTGSAIVSGGTSSHKIYSLNKPPLESKVYKELAEWTSTWCSGFISGDEKEIADAIIKGFAADGVIKYGEAGWDVEEILCTKDGMCGGMKEVFYHACATQGVHVTRFCYLLYDADPGSQTLWSGIVCQAPGIGQTEPTFSPRTVRWVDQVYPCPLYLGASSLSDDVVVETKKVYTFYAGDGHCINALDYHGEIYLYDLSFGTGPWPNCFPSIPKTGYYSGVQLHDFRANYHDYAVDHMYGNIYYNPGTGACSSLGTNFDVMSLIIPDKIGTQDQMKYYFTVTE